MAIYTILEAPGGDPRKTLFVKEGFAPWAVVFTFAWALWHRMWIVAAILFVVLAGLSLAQSELGLDETIAGLLQFGIALLFGFEARDLKIMSFRRAGWRVAGMAEASSLEAAELGYFAERPRAAAAPIMSKPHPLADDTLGLFASR